MKNKSRKKDIKEMLASVQVIAEILGLTAYIVGGKITIGDLSSEGRNRKNR